MIDNIDPANTGLEKISSKVFFQKVGLATPEGEISVSVIATKDGLIVGASEPLSTEVQLRALYEALRITFENNIKNLKVHPRLRHDQAIQISINELQIRLFVDGAIDVNVTAKLKSTEDGRFILLLKYPYRQLTNSSNIKLAVAACYLAIAILDPLIKQLGE